MIEALPQAVADAGVRHVRVYLEGVVQGVGLRPFVYRLATSLCLEGWVRNTAGGVVLEIEGSSARVESFLQRLSAELPDLARVERFVSTECLVRGARGFRILDSVAKDSGRLSVPPDLAPCEDCVDELFDPDNRRYRYPFICCTACGPRFSIVQGLPYDRRTTTMHPFPMCTRCLAEFNDPGNRRFHAQANACADCGPALELWDGQGQLLAQRDDALVLAAAAVRDGEVLALKGVGGFALIVDARNENAVERLRQRKHRPQKPLAVLVPGMDEVEAMCELRAEERDLLRAPGAPIVLLRRRESVRVDSIAVCRNVAPDNAWLGVMLPATPLHHLLMQELAFPVVATSGNLSGEPLCVDERDAIQRLAGIADRFLVHDRAIARPLDDSVARVVAGRELMLRHARGYAPLIVATRQVALPAVLGLGGHLKSAAALTSKGSIICGPHVGDLDTELARASLRASVADIAGLSDVEPTAVACDEHPDYYTTHFAHSLGKNVIPVQHHVAHIAACLAENDLHERALGVAWDGAGYGEDGTLWGGEFFIVDDDRIRRVAHLRPFALPGGQKAMTEPRRAALGLLFGMIGESAFALDLAPIEAFHPPELEVLHGMLTRGVNSPLTTSAGRLFDAMAALLDLCQVSTFEGQAAMALESAQEAARNALNPRDEVMYELRLLRPKENSRDPAVLDWRPMVEAVIGDLSIGTSATSIAAAIHSALARGIGTVARWAGEQHVILTGGCFQSRCLTEATIDVLRKDGLTPHWHRLVPPNDGGLAVGQAAWAARAVRAQ